MMTKLTAGGDDEKLTRGGRDLDFELTYFFGWPLMLRHELSTLILDLSHVEINSGYIFLKVSLKPMLVV